MVNEISILMHMLSNKNNVYQIGATKGEILHILNVKNKNKSGYFQNLITNLSNYIEPLGLQIRYNPINSHWFITYESEVSDLVSRAGNSPGGGNPCSSS